MYTNNTVEGYHGAGRPASAQEGDQDKRTIFFRNCPSKISLSDDSEFTDQMENDHPQLEGSSRLNQYYTNQYYIWERIKLYRFD